MKTTFKKIGTTAFLLVAIVYYFLFGSNNQTQTYSFRSESLLEEHYEKHGSEMGSTNKEDYLQRANEVIQNPDSLHKTEKEDGDDVYYLEATNELVIVSTDGYIRTYFLPDDGKNFYDKQ